MADMLRMVGGIAAIHAACFAIGRKLGTVPSFAELRRG